MLVSIVDHVRRRVVPLSDNPLALTGPVLLEKCYQRVVVHAGSNAPQVSLTYRDSVRAQYPYTGLVGRKGLLAFEQPNAADYPAKKVDSAEASADDRWTVRSIRLSPTVARRQGRDESLLSGNIIYSESCGLVHRTVNNSRSNDIWERGGVDGFPGFDDN